LKEDRGFSRVKLDVILSNVKKQQIQTDNVSQNGICIITEEPYKEGKYLSRMVMLPGGNEINVLGKVVWCSKFNQHLYKSGVEFISINSADREKLKKYIKKIMKLEKRVVYRKVQ
jgi:Tfp pilus assembly protein PilZ